MLPRVRPPPRDPKQQGRDQAAPGDKLRSSGALLKAANAMADMRVLESGYEPKCATFSVFTPLALVSEMFDRGSSDKPSGMFAASSSKGHRSSSQRSALNPYLSFYTGCRHTASPALNDWQSAARYHEGPHTCASMSERTSADAHAPVS